MTCGRVVIINKGRVVAEDTPDNLTHRLRGAAAPAGRGAGRGGPVEGALRAVAGRGAVRAAAGEAGTPASRWRPEPGSDVRAEVARALVGQGLDLLGLQQAGMSLEEIFLHLTTTDAAAERRRRAAPEPEPPAAEVNA